MPRLWATYSCDVHTWQPDEQSVAALAFGTRPPQPGTGDPMDLARSELDADQQARAERLADDLYARYFQGRPPIPKPTTPTEMANWWCERDR